MAQLTFNELKHYGYAYKSISITEPAGLAKLLVAIRHICEYGNSLLLRIREKLREEGGMQRVQNRLRIHPFFELFVIEKNKKKIAELQNEKTGAKRKKTGGSSAANSNQG